MIQAIYQFVKDSPGALKNLSVKDKLEEKLLGLLNPPQLKEEQQLQVYFLLEQFFGNESAKK